MSAFSADGTPAAMIGATDRIALDLTLGEVAALMLVTHSAPVEAIQGQLERAHGTGDVFLTDYASAAMKLLSAAIARTEQSQARRDLMLGTGGLAAEIDQLRSEQGGQP